MPKFKKVPALPDFVENEREWLSRWDKEGLLQKYLRRNNNSEKRFSFLDGPITANNPMGVHHAHGRTLKDFFQRYKNMQGYKQRFQNGFDCQGLWLEVEEEKEKGFNSKREIEEYGLEQFCRDCRARVDRFSQVQTEQSKRLGMFMDWENSYYTMSEKNNQYIWYFLKICWEKELLRYGLDVLPWCARCGTAISQHELSDEGWRDIEHLSVFVKFKIQNPKSKMGVRSVNLGSQLFFLAWTTTPWTLSSNTALAVHPDLDYVLATGEIEGNSYILAKKAAERLGLRVQQGFRGQDLIGLEYGSLYPELPVQQGFGHKVVPWKDVSEEEGTGIVHIAPGAGKQDFELAKKFDLKIIEALDENGVYQSGFGFLTGKSALDVADEVIKDLKKKKRLFAAERVIHSYPHCWRCKTELVFRASREWFIKTDPVREELIGEAKKVNWMPKFAGLRMQDWLVNMGDWPISRKRYWGLALPFWVCGGCGELTVIGSRKELREKAIDPVKVDELPELHRPWIDGIKIECFKCGNEAVRVRDVGDCWLDAGIVPFSTARYLEDRDYFNQWYPFEFITEYIAQVKLWFYATLFMSVVLEGRAPWKNVLATGFVVDEKGEAMHKSKGNAIWFDEAVEEMGADVMRWIYLSSTASREASSLRFGPEAADKVRKRLVLILWNVYKFFVTYANLDGWEVSEIAKLHAKGQAGKSNISNLQFRSQGLSILDDWILSRLNSTIETVTESLDSYDTPTTCKLIENFVLNDLSTWYVRRSRDRVGPTAAEGEDKNACHTTFYIVLVRLTKLLAPFMPFLAEELYQALLHPTGLEDPAGLEELSVHLQDWPVPDAGLISSDLEEQMTLVRQIVEKGHAARKEAGIKLRQPLKECKVYSAKHKVLQSSLSSLIFLLQDELNVKEIVFEKGENDEIKIELDTNLTSELIVEGRAREMIRQIQAARKKAGCQLDEWIETRIPALPEYKEVIEKFDEKIRAKTLSSELILDAEISQFQVTPS